MKELVHYECSYWRIAKEVGVSYTTVRAWAKGWWNPSYANQHKLLGLLIKVKREKGIF